MDTNDPHQIAVDAAKQNIISIRHQILVRLGMVNRVDASQIDFIDSIIQSAIEKATEGWANKLQWAKTDSFTEGYNKALGEWLRGEQPSRAAHASDGDANIVAENAKRCLEHQRAAHASEHKP